VTYLATEVQTAVVSYRHGTLPPSVYLLFACPDMAVDDYYRSHFAPVMNIYFAPSSVAPTVAMTATPGTWSSVSQPSYHKGQFAAKPFHVFFRIKFSIKRLNGKTCYDYYLSS